MKRRPICEGDQARFFLLALENLRLVEVLRQASGQRSKYVLIDKNEIERLCVVLEVLRGMQEYEKAHQTGYWLGQRKLEMIKEDFRRFKETQRNLCNLYERKVDELKFELEIARKQIGESSLKSPSPPNPHFTLKQPQLSQRDLSLSGQQIFSRNSLPPLSSLVETEKTRGAEERKSIHLPKFRAEITNVLALLSNFRENFPRRKVATSDAPAVLNRKGVWDKIMAARREVEEDLFSFSKSLRELVVSIAMSHANTLKGLDAEMARSEELEQKLTQTLFEKRTADRMLAVERERHESIVRELQAKAQKPKPESTEDILDEDSDFVTPNLQGYQTLQRPRASQEEFSLPKLTFSARKSFTLSNFQILSIGLAQRSPPRPDLCLEDLPVFFSQPPLPPRISPAISPALVILASSSAPIQKTREFQKFPGVFEVKSEPKHELPRPTNVFAVSGVQSCLLASSVRTPAEEPRQASNFPISESAVLFFAESFAPPPRTRSLQLTPSFRALVQPKTSLEPPVPFERSLPPREEFFQQKVAGFESLLSSISGQLNNIRDAADAMLESISGDGTITLKQLRSFTQNFLAQIVADLHKITEPIENALVPGLEGSIRV